MLLCRCISASCPKCGYNRGFHVWTVLIYSASISFRLCLSQACDYCLAPDISGDGTGSDNMTMMVVLLKKDLSVPQVSRKKKRHSDAAAAASEDADAPAEASSTPAKKRRRRAR